MIGNNGIITKARDAKEATEQATVNDQIAMNSLYDELAGFLDESNGGNGGGSGGSGDSGGENQSLVSRGDYIINYPVQYSNVSTQYLGEQTIQTTHIPSDMFVGWRVLSKEKDQTGRDYVKLISAGVPICYDHPNESGGPSESVKNLTTGFLTTEIANTPTKYKFYNCGFTNIGNNTNLSNVFENDFTDEVHALTKEELDSVVGQTAPFFSYVNNDEYNNLLAIPCKDRPSEYANTWLATEYDSTSLWSVQFLGNLSKYNNEAMCRSACGGYSKTRSSIFTEYTKRRWHTNMDN